MIVFTAPPIFMPDVNFFLFSPSLCREKVRVGEKDITLGDDYNFVLTTRSLP